VGQLRPEQKRGPAQDYQPEPDRGSAEHDDLGDLFGIEPPPRIETVAKRSAAQRGEANVVTERHAGERGERHLPIGERVTGIAQPQPVEPGQAQIARSRKAARPHQPGQRNGRDGGNDLVEAVSADDAVEKECRKARPGNGDDQRPRMGLPPLWHRSSHPSGPAPGSFRLVAARPPRCPFTYELAKTMGVTSDFRRQMIWACSSHVFDRVIARRGRRVP
jgi:hypothetical protein